MAHITDGINLMLIIYTIFKNATTFLMSVAIIHFALSAILPATAKFASVSFSVRILVFLMHCIIIAAILKQHDHPGEYFAASVGVSTVLLSTATSAVVLALMISAKAEAVLNCAAAFVARRCFILKLCGCSEQVRMFWATLLISLVASLGLGLVVGATDVLRPMLGSNAHS